ncbi:MAG: hypothetical protein IJ100_03975 [Lachnospiraceae bacterium]|nr:hypothetical protein [Lachnospiraceae bacterium]
MGVIRVTPRPSYYAALEEEERRKPVVEPEPDPVGTLSLRFEIGGLRGLQTWQQREIKDVIRRGMKEKPAYVRQYNNSDDKGYYTWDGFMLRGNTVYTDRFFITDMERVLRLIRILDEEGWYPEDEMEITYYPESRDISTLFNLTNIMESRRPLIEQALSLKDEMKIIVNYGLALGVSLSAFSYTAVEAAAYLIEQACKMALATGKARMKPCDMSNPKFQMRSWLLRLGFIGEQFERPRKTLLEGLEGDTAFFSEDQKRQSIARRKAKKLNGVPA